MGRAIAAGCAHCGLPSRGEPYCCYGCELAAELSREASRDQVRLRASLGFCALMFVSVMMLSMFLYADDLYAAGASAGAARLRAVFRWGAAVLATPVVLLLGPSLVRRAVAGLGRRRATMDLLLASGVFAAYALSLGALATGGPIYFDAACAALVLSALGRYLEARARAAASALIGPSLRRAASPVTRADGRELAPADIEPGDVVVIAEGQIVPVDLRVVGDAVDVDLAVVTGESAPVRREPGSTACAGAVPVSGALTGEALRPARDSTLARLDALARDLRARRAPLQRAADRLAAWLVPVVWLVAVVCVVYWAPRVGLGGAVAIALAVVLAACPCAYGVATPLALWVALRHALARGVLVRSAAVLEELARVRAVVFDKTGTLTRGELALARVELTGDLARGEALAAAAGLAAGSPHPVARAIAAGADRAVPIGGRRVAAGGILGRDPAGRELRFGSAAFAGGEGGSARAVLTRDGALLARFYLDETVRDDAPGAVAALRARGLQVSVATGDGGPAARAVARRLGVECAAGLTPEAKVAALDALGRQRGAVAMVGDGINDAPALAGLGPSFAMPGAAGIARGVAGVALITDDLGLVPFTLGLAARTRRIIVGNLVWATGYNAAFVALAAAGMLRPVWAALAMLGSSIVVIGRALRLAEASP